MSNSKIKVGSDFIQALLEATSCVSIDDSRKVLHGVLIDKTSVVGTDGKRLYVRDFPELVDIGFEEDLIIPVAACKFLSKTKVKEFMMEIAGEKHRWQAVRFTGEDIEYRTKTIQGRYPDYRQVIPTSYGHRLVIDKDEMKRAIDFLKATKNLLKSATMNYVNLEADEKSGELKISWRESLVGSESIILKTEGNLPDTKLNYVFFEQALSLGLNTIWMKEKEGNRVLPHPHPHPLCFTDEIDWKTRGCGGPERQVVIMPYLPK